MFQETLLLLLFRLVGGFSESKDGVVTFPDISTTILEKICQYFYWSLQYSRSILALTFSNLSSRTWYCSLSYTQNLITSCMHLSNFHQLVSLKHSLSHLYIHSFSIHNKVFIFIDDYNHALRFLLSALSLFLLLIVVFSLTEAKRLSSTSSLN